MKTKQRWVNAKQPTNKQTLETTTHQVTAETPVSTIKTLATSDLGISPGERVIVVFNGKPLSNGATLGSAGVADQDLLLVTTSIGADGAVSDSVCTPCLTF